MNTSHAKPIKVPLLGFLGMLLALWIAPHAMAGDQTADPPPPAVNDAAPAVDLKDLQNNAITLDALREKQTVVVIFLRGWPGYQCPLCTKQFAQYLAATDKFKAANARVLFIYPGNADSLKKHAGDFIHGKKLPDQYDLVLDPDYVVTNAWHLRWNKAGETAYPSTFIVDSAGTIRLAKISHEHGDRSTPSEMLTAIETMHHDANPKN